MSEAQASSLDLAINKFDQIVATTQDVRLRLQSKLLGVIESMEISPTKDTARLTEVQMGTINTLASLLNDTDKAALSVTNVRMKQKEADLSGQNSQMIAELLKSYSGRKNADGTTKIIDVEAEHLLIEQQFHQTNQTIDDTELRTSPDDLS